MVSGGYQSSEVNFAGLLRPLWSECCPNEHKPTEELAFNALDVFGQELIQRRIKGRGSFLQLKEQCSKSRHIIKNVFDIRTLGVLCDLSYSQIYVWQNLPYRMQRS